MQMKNRVGEIKNSNDCGLMKIIKYKNNSNITVKFKTGSIAKTQYSNFKKGNVKDPLFPNIFEIGYVGIGKFKTRRNNKIAIEYTAWHGMFQFQRCYDPYYINTQLTYQNVTVCKEWWNFQTFAEWHQKNHYELLDERVELDKDIIKRDNKIYSPEFCAFVPQSINMLLVKCDKSRGKYPIGVHKDKNKYQASLRINGKQKYIGYFTTPEKAFNAYKKEKEKQIKIITNKYKKVLNRKVYNSLMIYEVKITD